MCLHAGQDQVGLEFFEKIGISTCKGMVVAVAEIAGQLDELIGALGGGGEEEIIRPFGFDRQRQSPGHRRVL